MSKRDGKEKERALNQMLKQIVDLKKEKEKKKTRRRRRGRRRREKKKERERKKESRKRKKRKKNEKPWQRNGKNKNFAAISRNNIFLWYYFFQARIFFSFFASFMNKNFLFR